MLQAITKDSKSSPAEAETEFYAGMDAVQKLYEGLNFEKSLQQEYIVTKGKDNTERRIGVGLVGIRPQKHSRFYSVVSPVAAAIAAGNCVLLEV
jgi:acyl-CoA reductase-like NAD-dependent aldehyde dehydrogenase